MWDDVLVRYIHFIGIFSLASLLVAEHLLLKSELTINEVRRLAVIDRFYGASAAVTLLAGLTLWFGVGKPAGFYSGNPVFHAKVTLFVLIGLISIVPTLFFTKSATLQTRIVEVPKRIVMLIRLQLLGLLSLPLLATIMAKGIGFSG